MDGLTERQRLILWIEAMQKDFEIIERLVEQGEGKKALGHLHACWSRAEYKRVKLLMEEAVEARKAAEREEAEFNFPT